MTIRPATSSVPVVAGLFAAVVAWLVVPVQAGGMESAPGNMGLGAAAFLGLWAAMMLPALAPLGALYAGEGPGRTARAGELAAGHVLTRALFGGLALKDRCLAVCRSPLHVPMRTGAYHGPLRPMTMESM